MPSTVHTQHWDVRRLPRAEGRTFLVTGGNAGIGYFVAEQLASTRATVILGSRDPAKADAAMASIRSHVPGAHLRHLRLDLADLASLASSVDRWRWTPSTRSCATPVCCSTSRNDVRPRPATN